VLVENLWITPLKEANKMAALEKELETYRRELASLSAQEGKFVLIFDGRVVDTFETYEDALKEGYDKFGLEPFLVKQIHAVERVQFITRNIHFRPSRCHI
jgi:hypothetical protein